MEPRPADELMVRRAVWIALAIAVLAFGFRYLAHGRFTNDQFVHLARAHAIRAGDLPHRDFMEEGIVLTSVLSAVALWAGGDTLLGEAVLTMGLLAIGAGISAAITLIFTRRTTLAVWAGILPVLVYPRLYSHIKLSIYPAMVALAWWYGRRPDLNRLVVLAGGVAIAFLLRHDHGVYAGLGAAAAVWCAHSSRRAIVPLAQLALLVVALLLPYLVWIEYWVGLREYFQTGVAISRSEAQRTRLTLPLFDVTPGPLLVRRPLEASDLPGIHVRWREDVADSERVLLERQLQLQFPEPHEGRTWTYRVIPPATGVLRGLVFHPRVDDTSGFDRRTYALEDRRGSGVASWWRQLAVGPGLTSALGRRNAAALLVVTTCCVIALGFAVWAAGGERERDRRTAALALLTMGAASSAGFLRDAIDQRVQDVFGTMPIMIMWLAAGALGPARSWIAAARAGVVIAVLLVCTGCVLIVGRAGEMVGRTRLLEGPGAMIARAASVTQELREWPWPRQWPGDRDWEAARYVHDCTRPGDRLLVTWNAPEHYFFSRRLFAGGETLLIPVFRPPHTYEAKVLARLRSQSVPLVVAEEGQYHYFAQSYPAVAAYLAAEYDVVATFNGGPERQLRVMAHRERIATRTDPALGWPCFAAP